MSRFTTNYSQKSWDVKEAKRIANREAMKKEGEYYTNIFGSYIADGVKHNQATKMAVTETVKQFNTRRGWHVGYTTPEEHQKGRLVYIGAYKSLQRRLRDTLSVKACMEILVQEIPDFHGTLQGLGYLAKNKTQLFGGALVYLYHSGNQELYNEIKAAYKESKLID